VAPLLVDEMGGEETELNWWVYHGGHEDFHAHLRRRDAQTVQMT
jgi:hypothetical protein